MPKYTEKDVYHDRWKLKVILGSLIIVIIWFLKDILWR